MTLALTPSRLVRETEIHSLGERLDLLFRRISTNEIVAVEIVLPMGSREENPDEAGITTLALRMLTRGTRSLSDSEIAFRLESLGASFSTEVQKDRAVLSVVATVPKLHETLDLVEELLAESVFPEEPFRIEKEILIQEIREDLDSPFHAAGRLFQKTLFDGHPYGHPGTGTQETVASLGRDRAKAYFDSLFGTGTAAIGVVGNVDPDFLRERFTRLLAPYATSSSDSSGKDSAPVLAKPPDRVRKAHEERSTEAECVVYGYPAPPVHHGDYAALRVLDSVLGGSMDSRLFSEIREKQGLVYQIGSAYRALEWQGTFAVSFVTTPQNLDRVLETLENQLDQVRNIPPDPDELDRAVTYLQGTFLMSQEKNADQALLLAKFHSLGLGVEFIEKYPRILAGVSPERVTEAASRHLGAPTLAVVGPKECVPKG